MELAARLCAAGIFVLENLNHINGFKDEVDKLVAPALSPLPPSAAYALHAVTIGLGLIGSVAFLSGHRRFSKSSLQVLAVFMVVITWSWWFRRFGIYIWDVVSDEERRMRTIHCLKNLSIFGFILVLSHRTRGVTSQKSTRKNL